MLGKAFFTVSHSILLQKLTVMSCMGELGKKNCLDGWAQKVVLSGVKSSWQCLISLSVMISKGEWCHTWKTVVFCLLLPVSPFSIPKSTKALIISKRVYFREYLWVVFNDGGYSTSNKLLLYTCELRFLEAFNLVEQENMQLESNILLPGWSFH